MASLRWNRPTCTPFEHNMRFSCYSTALLFNLIGFGPKKRPKMRQFFEFLYILNKKLIFLSVFIAIIIISDLTINIRSTFLKKVCF